MQRSGRGSEVVRFSRGPSSAKMVQKCRCKLRDSSAECRGAEVLQVQSRCRAGSEQLQSRFRAAAEHVQSRAAEHVQR
jgi:hypothetical protein